MKGISKPEVCKEKNCTCLVKLGDYDPKKPYSCWCIGIRTGVIKGKEKAIENQPTDVIVKCVLLGSHSEDVGKHTFILNIGDQYLDMWVWFHALYSLGLLERTFRSVLNITGIHVIQELQNEIDRYNENKSNPHAIDIGSKFIEFSCSCKEVFFREYNEDQTNGKYYKPNKRDEVYFDVHRDLGHEVFYRKAKRVKKSKVGDNEYWQDWGLREYKRRKVNEN